MRNLKTRIALPAFLCAAALASFACGRGQEQAGKEAQISPAAAPAPVPVAAPQSQVNELRPLPQSVRIPEQTPPPPPPVAEPRPRVDSREKALAEREAKIAARERRLKEREQQARAAESRPAPEAASPEEPAAPAPEPAPVEPAPEIAPEPGPMSAEPPVEEPRTVEVSVPAGKVVEVKLKQRLASDTSKVGDIFRVQVARDVRVDGVVAIPRGSEIVGQVTEAVPLPRIGGQARLTLKLTDLVLPSGSTVPIHASLVQETASKTGRDAAVVGGGAAGGAILGNILGKGGGKASIVGAIVGAVAGAAVASRTGREEVVIQEGAVLGVRLNDALEVQARARP